MTTLPTVLITGFGPFPGVPVNASALLAERLALTLATRFPRRQFLWARLDTEWTAGLAALDKLYEQHRPSLALHFGVSARASGFAIETTARNTTADKPDAAGDRRRQHCVIEGASETLPARLPAEAIARRLSALAIPAATSEDAGDYLCNAVLFRALHHAEQNLPAARIGFVHIPASLAGHGDDGSLPGPGCPLDWSTAVAGGVEIARTCLGLKPPRPAR